MTNTSCYNPSSVLNGRKISRVLLMEVTTLVRFRTNILVAIERGTHLIPSRTQQLSPSSPMVLYARVWKSRTPPGFLSLRVFSFGPKVHPLGPFLFFDFCRKDRKAPPFWRQKSGNGCFFRTFRIAGTSYIPEVCWITSFRRARHEPA